LSYFSQDILLIGKKFPRSQKRKKSQRTQRILSADDRLRRRSGDHATRWAGERRKIRRWESGKVWR